MTYPQRWPHYHSESTKSIYNVFIVYTYATMTGYLQTLQRNGLIITQIFKVWCIRIRVDVSEYLFFLSPSPTPFTLLLTRCPIRIFNGTCELPLPPRLCFGSVTNWIRDYLDTATAGQLTQDQEPYDDRAAHTHDGKAGQSGDAHPGCGRRRWDSITTSEFKRYDCLLL